MVQMRNEFLDSAGFINKNQAEYSILTDLYNACSNKCFLFQLKNLDGIKNFYTDVVKYINDNYKSFELMKFVLNEEGIISHEILNNMAGSSLNIPMQMSTLFGNSEHPFPEKQCMSFRK